MHNQSDLLGGIQDLVGIWCPAWANGASAYLEEFMQALLQGSLVFDAQFQLLVRTVHLRGRLAALTTRREGGREGEGAGEDGRGGEGGGEDGRGGEGAGEDGRGGEGAGEDGRGGEGRGEGGGEEQGRMGGEGRGEE